MLKVVYKYYTLFSLDRIDDNYSEEVLVTEEEYQILKFIESTRIQNLNGTHAFSESLVLDYCLNNLNWASKYCKDECGNPTQDFESDFYLEIFTDEVLDFAPKSFWLYESKSDVNPNGPDTGGGFAAVILADTLKDMPVGAFQYG